jgi:hypothetical protein
MTKINPMSKEFQDEAKRLGLTGNQLIQKYIKEGKLPHPADLNKERNEQIAKRANFENRNAYAKHLRDIDIEYRRKYLQNWRHENCIQQPLEENTECAHYLGTYIAERQYGRKILPIIFGGIEKEMPYGNPQYDFIVKNGIKVDIKSCVLREPLKGWKGWEPHVRWNKNTDYFVMLAFDDRENLNLFHIWVVEKNVIIRGREFYKRESIKITDTRRGLLEFILFDHIGSCVK